MTAREKVIQWLEICTTTKCQEGCPYMHKGVVCQDALMRDALELLKAQEPRLVVKEDFINADRWGYLPVYVEDRDGTVYWDCITDAALGDTVSRFWMMKPTEEQRKAVKWDE